MARTRRTQKQIEADNKMKVNVAKKKVDTVKKKINTSADILKAAKDRRNQAEKKRKALGALPGQKLFAEKMPGFELRWVSGNADRLDTLLNKGYSLVSNSRKDDCTLTTDLGSAKSQIVGKSSSGVPERHYLMAIPEEIYREDKITKEQVVLTQSETVKRNERDTHKMATAAGRAELYEP